MFESNDDTEDRGGKFKALTSRFFGQSDSEKGMKEKVHARNRWSLYHSWLTAAATGQLSVN